MDFIRKNRKTIQTIVGAAVMLLALFVVLFFIFKRCRAEYNADYTDTILWANAAVESGHFFNPDYWYAYFLPFSGVPLMIPIVAIFGLSYFSHQLGMAIFAVLFAAALYGFMRSLDFTYGESLTLSGITMILMCASQITRMIFYGHIIHYSLVIVFMGVGFILLKRSSVFWPDNPKSKLFDLAICIWCMLCCTNGMATVILFFLPFAGMLIVERYLDKTPISFAGDRKLFTTVAGFVAGGLVGYVIKMIFFTATEYEEEITALLPSDGWVWKQSPFLLEWIKVLAGDHGGDTLMMTFDGINTLAMYFLALVILVVPAFAIISYRKIESRPVRLFIIYYWLMFATTMLTYSVSYALVQTWRLAGLICTALMLTLVYTTYMLKNNRFVRWFILMVPVIAVCTFLSMLSVKNIPSALNANPNDDLLNIYREHGLTRGYSFFWNSANTVTVLSGGEVVVSPIVIYPDGHYEVRKYQSEPWEYEDVPGLDRYFVAVDYQDMQYASDTLGKYKIDEIKYQDDLYIWVFDRNIFKNLEPVFKDHH